MVVYSDLVQLIISSQLCEDSDMEGREWLVGGAAGTP